MLSSKEGFAMGYFSKNYFIDDGESLEHRLAYGTANSVSDKKGTDNKKNNTSEYNHAYYMKNKKKWADNESSSDKKELDTDEAEFDVDAAAMDVIRGKYKNGEERKRILGEDYDMIQKRVNELMKKGVGKTAKEAAKEKAEAKEEEKKEGASSKKNRSFDEAYKDYKGTKKKSAKHSDDYGSILISSLF